MLREIFSDISPNTKFRKIAAIVLYVFFMLCIILTNNKNSGEQKSSISNASTLVK